MKNKFMKFPLCYCLVRKEVEIQPIPGGVFSVPLKGGVKKGNAGGQWVQPKDWDWSVTTASSDKPSTGRLIPVSEATDDLPTPDYKMSDLQQKVLIVPSVIAVNQAVLNSKAGLGFRPLIQNNQVSDINEEGILQSLDTPQNISIIKEIIPLQTTTLPENEHLDNRKPEVKERVPVEEPPVVKVTLTEYCSISGIGCGDRRRTPNVSRNKSQAEHKIEELHTNGRTNEQLENTSTKVTSTQDLQQTTLKYDDKSSELNESELSESNQHSENINSTPPPSSQEINKNETIPSTKKPVNENTHDGSSEETKQIKDPEGIIEDDIVEKVENFDNLQYPAHEDSFDDQIPIGSSDAEDQKLLIPNYKPIKENSHKHNSSNQETVLRREGDSIEEDDQFLHRKRKQNDNQDDKSSEEEQKLTQTVTSEKEQLTTEEPKIQPTESPSFGERITGYWRAATGFVSRHIGL